MERAQVHELVADAWAADTATADLASLTATMAAAQRLRAALDAREMMVAAAMGRRSVFPEKHVAAAALVGLAEAGRIVARNRTATEIPALAEACAQGRVTARHVDAFAKVLKNVSAPVADRLRADAVRLVGLAATMSAEGFAQLLRREAERAEPAGDDDARLQRQKRAVRLRSFTDSFGMGRWIAHWDPKTFADLEHRLDERVEALFHDRTPEHCPSDPLERQQFLRAHALVDLATKGGMVAARPRILVVRRSEDGELRVDWGQRGIDLPDAELAELARCATIFHVAVQNGDIVSAPGQLSLGRSTRLANRAQRRALAAVHATCAIPGCEVGYWRTKLHHVVWWRNGGPTDLDNLIPLCAHHHTRVHAENWHIKLSPGRIITITLPDGTTLDHAPARRTTSSRCPEGRPP